MTAERIAAKRRYTTRFLGAMSVYALLIVLMIPLVKRVEPTWAKAVLALVPLVPVVVALAEVLRFFASLDELERRMQFEAVAAAAILTALLTFAWGLLELAGLPRLPAVMVMPLFCGVYGVAVCRSALKYR